MTQASISAKLRTDGMQKAPEEEDPGLTHGRESSSDNASSRNVKATSPRTKQGNTPILKGTDQSLVCWHGTTNLKYSIVGSRSEGLLEAHTKRAAAIQDRTLEDYAEVPKHCGKMRQIHDLGGLPNHEDGSGDVTDSTILESEHLVPQPEIELDDSEDACATCSGSKNSRPATELIPYDHEDSCRDSTRSDVAMCDSRSSLSDSTNSLSSSEISDPKYPTGYNIASQGVGTQFERSSPLSCSLNSATCPAKDKVANNGVTRARGRFLWSLLNICG